jgi:hypothetical protein
MRVLAGSVRLVGVLASAPWDAACVYSRYELALLMGTDTVRLTGRSTEVFLRRNGRWVNPGWHLGSGR